MMTLASLLVLATLSYVMLFTYSARSGTRLGRFFELGASLLAACVLIAIWDLPASGGAGGSPDLPAATRADARGPRRPGTDDCGNPKRCGDPAPLPPVPAPAPALKS